MKNLFKIITTVLALLIPSVTFAAFGANWQATSTTNGIIIPSQINGINPNIWVNSIRATSTTATSQFNGYFKIGDTIPQQPDGFGTKNYEFQIDGNVNDVVGGNIFNTNAGAQAATGLFFGNNLTPLGTIGLAATYYGGMAYSGSNWNGPLVGLGALPPNSLAVYASDGRLILGSATSTGEIDSYVGAGSFAGGVPDMSLISNGNLGIATSSPWRRLSVGGGSSDLGANALAGSFTATSTDATSTISTGGLTVGTSQFVVQQNSGFVGIGTAVPTRLVTIGGSPGALNDSQVGLRYTPTALSGTIAAKETQLIASHTSAAAGTYYADFSQVGNATGATSTLSGLNGYGTVVIVRGSGAISNSIQYGAGTVSYTGGVGSITNYLGFSVSDIPSASTTNAYGFYSNMTTAQSNRWSFYGAGNAPSYFAGNVGIGSSTPFAHLGLKGLAASTGLNFLTSDSNDLMNFAILDNGNVGIGTTSRTIAQFKTDIGNAQLTTQYQGGPTTVGKNNLAAINIANTSSASVIGQTECTKYSWFTSITLQVSTCGRLTTGSGSGLSDFAVATRLVSSDTDIQERFTVKSGVAGMVGIGTTTPSAILGISNERTTTANTPLLMIASTTDGTATTTKLTLTNTGNLFLYGLSNSNTGDYVCFNTTTSEIEQSATACSLSSIRYKENIRPLTYGLVEVLKMHPILYDKKPEYGTDKNRPGFIAEEAVKVVPFLVPLNKEGEPDNFDYVQYTAVLTKAIQELAARTGGIVRSAEENWQWLAIGLLALGLGYQQLQIIKLKK